MYMYSLKTSVYNLWALPLHMFHSGHVHKMNMLSFYIHRRADVCQSVGRRSGSQVQEGRN